MELEILIALKNNPHYKLNNKQLQRLNELLGDVVEMNQFEKTNTAFNKHSKIKSYGRKNK
jgi:hypothetical protein